MGGRIKGMIKPHECQDTWIQIEKLNKHGYIEGTLTFQFTPATRSEQGWRNYTYIKL